MSVDVCDHLTPEARAWLVRQIVDDQVARANADLRIWVATQLAEGRAPDQVEREALACMNVQCQVIHRQAQLAVGGPGLPTVH
jgi:hypothetical protein